MRVASIELLRAEVAVGEYRAPVALIRYALQGVEQGFGLRLDMDKRVILDHFEDEELESTVQKAAPKIVEYVGSVLYPRELTIGGLTMEVRTIDLKRDIFPLAPQLSFFVQR